MTHVVRWGRWFVSTVVCRAPVVQSPAVKHRRQSLVLSDHLLGGLARDRSPSIITNITVGGGGLTFPLLSRYYFFFSSYPPSILSHTSRYLRTFRALSTISFVTVATVHTALIICILPNLSHRVPWGWERVAMTLSYLLFNKNSINETLLSVLYFNTYDCVYTYLVFSGCVVIVKIFTEVYCMIFV